MCKNIFCLGNALFDISAPCSSHLLEKYHLKSDENAEATSEHDQLFMDLLSNPNAFNSPGGSAQNTARVAQWILDSLERGRVTFVGCIGRDVYGQKLQEHMKKSNVNVVYDVHGCAPTGVTAALVTEDSKRSLCARLGAAALFDPNFINSAVVQSEIQKCEIIYVEGYFLSHNPNCVLELASMADRASKTFALNLSAAYICENYCEILKRCVILSDIVFGNKDEAAAFLRCCKLSSTSVEDCAVAISSLPCKRNSNRITVITQGADPVVVSLGKTVSVYNVPHVDQLHDTIGCGDAFVGGFLSAVLLHQTTDVATRWGIYCATEIAKNRGCTVPSFRADIQ